MHGTGSSRHGAAGTDFIIPVPLGTIVRQDGDEESGTALAELLQAGQRALLAQGGRGGAWQRLLQDRPQHVSSHTPPLLKQSGWCIGIWQGMAEDRALLAQGGIIGNASLKTGSNTKVL